MSFVRRSGDCLSLLMLETELFAFALDGGLTILAAL